jgi:protein-S-isoprenylcysteine O-methyltransferase Ste14
MNQAIVGWLNFAVLVISSIVFSVLYVLSVRPAHLEQKIGEKAYRRCGQYRLISMVPMTLASLNYVLYHWYPLPIDPLPARFPWPYWVSVVITVALSIPALTLMIRGVRDAGKETLAPDKAHTMYGGIYQKIRHPQAAGEAPSWIGMALLVNSPFLAVFSLIYLGVWYWWCVEEEKDLLLRYGQAYADYRARTGMFWPKTTARRRRMNQDAATRNHRLVRIVAILLAIYTLIEITDCVTLLLMHFGVIGNFYPQLAFVEFNTMMVSHPLALFPVFLFFTMMRGLSAWGLFRERVWGFWTAIIVCGVTILWIPFLMPAAGLSALEMPLDGLILFLLLKGRFGDQTL